MSKQTIFGEHADVNSTAGSILGFLANFGELTGWDIAQMIDQSIGNFWNVTRSQVYRELRDLDERGLVIRGQSGPRHRVPYEITETGKVALQSWLAEDPGPETIRNRMLLTVFFSDYLEPHRLSEILTDQRAMHVRTLERYRELQSQVGTAGAMAATLRFGITYEESFIEWIDSLSKDAFSHSGQRGV